MERARFLKRGNLITDPLVFLIEAFALCVVIVMIYFVVVNVSPSFQNIAENNVPDGVNGTAIYEGTIGKVPSAYAVLKWITFILIVAMVIGIFIGNFLVKSHPLIIIPYVIYSAICVVISVYLSNVYVALLSDPTLGATMQEFVLQNYFFIYLPIWMTIICLIGGFLLAINIPRDRVGDAFS